MARNWKSRQAPPPTSITEICRRYAACAAGLARAFGLPLTETFLREHRESISCCFIEAGRAGVRLPPAVQLPPLSEPTVEAPAEAGEIMCSGRPPAPEAPTSNGHGATIQDARATAEDRPAPENGAVAPSPTTIPTDAGLPCGGALIADLTPPQLHMLVSKVGFRMLAEPTYVPLLHALQAERARRLERGRKHAQPTGEG